MKDYPTGIKGFTLVELLIVIAIISILAAIAVPQLMTYRTLANKKSAIANARACLSDVAAQLANNPLSSPVVAYCSTVALDGTSCTCTISGQTAACTVGIDGKVNCA